MPLHEMKLRIKSAYKTQTWKIKVDRMPDSQVVAVYLRFKSRGMV